jgi:hypothetical protein
VAVCGKKKRKKVRKKKKKKRKKISRGTVEQQTITVHSGSSGTVFEFDLDAKVTSGLALKMALSGIMATNIENIVLLV